MRALRTAAGCLALCAALISAGCERTPDDPAQPQNATSPASSTLRPSAPRSAAPLSGALSAADSAALLKVLADADAAPQALLDAIHTARDGKIAAAIPALKRLLEDTRPGIVVAAAAALAGLNAPDADIELIEAAGRLSRARRLESLRQLLYILGDLGGPRAKTYLETIAEAHESPAIQQAATQILQGIQTRGTF